MNMSLPKVLSRRPAPSPDLERNDELPWWHLGMFERYLISEIVPNLAGGMVIVVVLLLLGALFDKAGEIIAKGANVLLVLQYIAFKLPEALSRGLPIALLFAVLMGLTRLTQDSELKAAITLGFSPLRMAFPVLLVGLTVTALAFINQEAVTPRANEQALRVFKDIILQNPRVLVEAGQFLKDSQNQVIYIQPGGILEDGRLLGVTVIQGQSNSVPLSITRAPKGQILKDQGAIRLEAGVRVTYRSTDARKVTVAHFKTATVPIKDLQQGSNVSLEPSSMSVINLWQRVQQYKAQGLKVSNEETALNRKFAEPAAAIAFALFGVAMAFFSLRSSQNLGFVGVAFLTFFYYATWSVFKALGENGALPPVLAAWAPDFVYAGAAVVLFWVANRR
jgi:lipopolysaccharide export system permease protein